MNVMRYPAVFNAEAKGYYSVSFPDVPEALTSGKGFDHAVRQAEDCLAVALGGRMKDGDAIPLASHPKRGQRLIDVPLYLAPKVALYTALRELGWTNGRLAEKLGVSETVVRRLLNPHHDSKPEKLQAALEAVGKRIWVELADAA